MDALEVARQTYMHVLAREPDLPPHALLVAGSGGRQEMATFSDIDGLLQRQNHSSIIIQR